MFGGLACWAQESSDLFALRDGRIPGLHTARLLHTLTHFSPPLRFRNQFLPTVRTFAVRETDVSRHNGGALGAPLILLRDDRVLSSHYRL